MTIASDKKIIKDLNDRGMKVVLFVCEDENKQIQVLSYNQKGLIDFISEPANAICINERLEGRMIRPILEVNQTRKE